MHDVLIALSPFLAGWLAGAILVGPMGGFDLIRRIELSKEAKTPTYWLTLIIVYPIILLRAAAWALWEVTKGGAR